jgi:cell division protein FtsB
MKIKKAVLILIMVVAVSLFMNQSVYAQSNSVLNTVSLKRLNVQLIYPSQTLPGQPVTVSLLATAKNSFWLASLNIQVYFAEPGSTSLRQLTSATVAQNLLLATGGQISKGIQVSVPQDAPRTSLIALVSESETIVNNVAESPALLQATPVYITVSDNAVTPLTLIEAATPEYVALQSQYRQLQQTLNQTQAQNRKLQQDLQSAKDAIAQKDLTIADLNMDLNTQLNRHLIPLEVISAILAVALGTILVLFIVRRAKNS